MILLNLNVLLDVLQKREPHYRTSAAVLDAVVQKKVQGVVAAHAVTTMHYVVSRHQDVKTANRLVDWVLRYFTIASTGNTELSRARTLDWNDFEDAVVAATAESSNCEAVVTRNVKDFKQSPVHALTPDEYLVSASWEANGFD